MENKKLTRRRIIDSTSVPTSRRNGNKQFDIANNEQHEDAAGLSVEQVSRHEVDRGPVEMKLVGDGTEFCSNASDTARALEAANSNKLQVKSISDTTEHVGSYNFVRAQKTTSDTNDQTGMLESNKSKLVREKHSVVIGDKRVINANEFHRRVQEITAANAEIHSNAVDVNNGKTQVKAEVPFASTKFSDKNVTEYEACINASSYKKKEQLSNIENSLITIDGKIAEELSKVFEDSFYGKHKDNFGQVIGFDNASIPMEQNMKYELSFSDRVNTHSVKDNGLDKTITLTSAKTINVKQSDKNTTDLSDDTIKIRKAGPVLKSDELDITCLNDDNKFNCNQNTSLFHINTSDETKILPNDKVNKDTNKYNEKLKTNPHILECKRKEFSDKVITHDSEHVDGKAKLKFENDHRQFKDNCLILNSVESAKPSKEITNCESNSDKMKQLFDEDDVISSIDDDRSHSVVHSVMSDETLICHRNMGLFEKHTDIVKNRNKNQAPKFETFHKESLETNNIENSHFKKVVQKESPSNPSLHEHNDYPETLNNVHDIEPEVVIYHMTLNTEKTNNLQTDNQKDPYLVELGMTKCVLENDNSKQTMLDLYDAFLRSFQDSPFLNSLAEMPEEGDSDAENKVKLNSISYFS